MKWWKGCRPLWKNSNDAELQTYVIYVSCFQSISYLDSYFISLYDRNGTRKDALIIREKVTHWKRTFSSCEKKGRLNHQEKLVAELLFGGMDNKCEMSLKSVSTATNGKLQWLSGFSCPPFYPTMNNDDEGCGDESATEYIERIAGV